MTPTPPHRILVTGSAGAVGYGVCRALSDAGYTVRGFDRTATPDDHRATETVVGNLADANAVHDAARGCDAIVHLAANPDADAPLPGAMCDANILGQHHVMEAARLHKIDRVVLTSSVMVAWGLPWQQRIITLDDGVAPTTQYALTKIYGEHMGEMYARLYGMTVITIRLGSYMREPYDPQKMTDALQSIYLSTADAGKAYRLAIEADVTGCHVCYITSRRVADCGFDLVPARRILGYEPDDVFPQNMHRNAKPTSQGATAQ